MIRAAVSLTYLLAAFTAGTIATGHAADDPPIIPGMDPGGVAIALITDGIDYTDPEIAKRLARDGEGELIAFDFVDGDVRPFATADQSTGTNAAKILFAAHPTARLVVARVDRNQAASLAKAMRFVGKTPARIAIITDQSLSGDHLAIVKKAASRTRKTAFAISSSEPLKAPANLFVVAPPANALDPLADNTQALMEKAAQLSCLIEKGVQVSDLVKQPNASVASCQP